MGGPSPQVPFLGRAREHLDPIRVRIQIGLPDFHREIFGVFGAYCFRGPELNPEFRDSALRRVDSRQPKWSVHTFERRYIKTDRPGIRNICLCDSTLRGGFGPFARSSS